MKIILLLLLLLSQSLYSIEKFVTLGERYTCKVNAQNILCRGDNRNSEADYRRGFKNIKDVSSGKNHSCYIDDGKLGCFGKNDSGQTSNPELMNVTLVTSGMNHSCAYEDEEVHCWGDNSSGQANVPDELFESEYLAAGIDFTCSAFKDEITCFGGNPKIKENIPVVTSKIIGFKAGSLTACILQEDKNLKCWGESSLDTPEVTDFALGFKHFCYITKGRVQCLGENNKNQLKYPFENRNAVKIYSGVSANHTCVKFEEGDFDCWGGKEHGQLQINTTINPKKIIQFEHNAYHGCALYVDRSVHCYGWMNENQAGVPKDLPAVKKLEAGWNSVCAILMDDTIRCWGKESTANSPNLVGVTELISGSIYIQGKTIGWIMCAIHSSGAACWGDEPSYKEDLKKLLDKNVEQIAMNIYAVCALIDNKVECVGNDKNEALDVPENLGRIKTLKAHQTQFCALDEEAIKCWGKGPDEAPAHKRFPDPASASQIVRFEMKGGFGCYFLNNDHRPKCWGYNWWENLNVPDDLPEYREFSIGWYSACIITKDDQFQCWGTHRLMMIEELPIGIDNL